MAFYQLKTEQFLPTDLDTAWDFISRPENLKRITPEHMGFTITSGTVPEFMYPGLIISYRIQPFPGIRLTWVTEITHIRDRVYFVDEQRAGPYALWHHEHALEPVPGGVQMRDIVSYAPPLGPIGALAHALFIRRQLDAIFAHRRFALEQIFPG